MPPAPEIMPLAQKDKDWFEELLNRRVTELSEKVAGLQRSFSLLQSTLNEQAESILTLNARLNTECEVTKALRSRLNQLELSQDALEQYGRRYCVRVEGILEVKGETEEELFTTLKTNLSKIDII